MLEHPQQDTYEERVTRLVVEYAPRRPENRPLDARLALRADLAIQSLSLVSLILRLEEEFEVDLVESGIELRSLETIADLIAFCRTAKR